MENTLKTDFEMNFEKYMKINWVMHKQRFIKRLVLCLVLLCIATIALFVADMIPAAILVLIVTVFYPVIWYMQINNTIKNVYQSSLYQEYTIHYTFNEKEVNMQTPVGESTVALNKLYKVVETEDYVYMFISGNQAFPVLKQDCSDELKTLLKNLVK